MRMRTWNSPLVTFLSGGNTVILKDREEVNEFIRQMEILDIDVSNLLKAPYSLGLLVEYNNGKGVTFWNSRKTIGEAIQESKAWYEMDPFNWEDIKLECLDAPKALSFAQLQDEYWKRLILHNAESLNKHPTEETVEEITNLLLNDDEVWDNIDQSIRYYLEKEEN